MKHSFVFFGACSTRLGEFPLLLVFLQGDEELEQVGNRAGMICPQ